MLYLPYNLVFTVLTWALNSDYKITRQTSGCSKATMMKIAKESPEWGGIKDLISHTSAVVDAEG